MAPDPRTSLRRGSWRLFLVSLAALLIACSDDDSTSSIQSRDDSSHRRSVVVHLMTPVTDAEHLRATVAAFAGEMQIDVTFATASISPAKGELTITSTKPAYSTATAPLRYWGVFTGFWDLRESVDLTALSDASQTVYLPREYEAWLDGLVGDGAVAGITWLPIAEVTDAILASPSAIALLPVERADPRLRSLAADGVDFVRGEGMAPGSGLVERVYVGWQDESLADFGRKVAERLSVPAPSPIRVVVTGDIIPARCVYDRHRRANDYTSAFHGTADFLKAADITVGSLDGTISDAAEPIACEVTFSLLSPSRSVEGLSFAGIDVMTVASNHAKDCGRNGFCGDRPFLDTLANLRDAGIQPVGGGENLAQAHEPVIVTVKGMRFAFLGYDDVSSNAFGAGETKPGTAALSTDAVRRDVESAKRRADVVIVLPHWGIEYTSAPTQRQRDMAAVAVEAGATLVVGNHPHVVQAVEWQADAFVAYSLGNFVFDQDWSLETQQGAVFEATFLGSKLVAVRLHPVRIVDMHRPTWAGPSEAASILARMRAAGAALR